jgi:hypothetical protein
LGTACQTEKVGVRHFRLAHHEALDGRIIAAYEALREDPQTQKSHLFHGRYENIYPPREHFPEIEPLLSWIEERCREVLLLAQEPLGIAFWFNEMQPGNITTLHTHNDADELLSGVYYLVVPEASGEIVFHSGSEGVACMPAEGDLYLFAPSLPHEVRKNRSGSVRLSVAFNVGIRRSTDDA